jgi:iron-sulfur cluster repair protein YtfE (RIC family)
MLRDKNLIPLSHQHQRALALCVRMERAQPIADADLPAWQAEVEQLFEQEIKIHFAAEEEIIFPAAAKFSELTSLVEELLSEHIFLRGSFAQVQAQSMTGEGLAILAHKLSTHIRKEERQLFESLQRLMSAEQLAHLGRQLVDALKEATQACALPNAATKLRTKESPQIH